MKVAIAASSQLAADAGGEIARLGGNAVDAAIAAALVSANTEPGVCALAGGAYVTVWAPERTPETFDGQVRMPGACLPDSDPGQGIEAVEMGYGGGISTLVGGGTVGVPATVAALDGASRRYGALPWPVLFEPVIDIVRRGFTLPEACRHYLGYSGTAIFARSAEGHGALHQPDGRLHDPGTPIIVPGLAESLERIARLGAGEFYRGELGAAIVAHVQAHDGRLTREDMAGCEALVRPALTVSLGDWQIATTPPPAIGGVTLGAMLLAAGWPLPAGRTPEALARLVGAQQLALDFRRRRLDGRSDVTAQAAMLLALAQTQRGAGLNSPSTVHVSATDTTGLCCAITLSAGYGSGLIAPGTGLWLNNCLGELELHAGALATAPPGTPLPSNMAPTAARSDRHRSALAIGSPGADRITTAIMQVLVHHLGAGIELQEAIAHPRLHLEFRDQQWQVAAEPGLDCASLGLPVRAFDALSMYFGGVGATRLDANNALVAAADPRRAGGVRVAGAPAVQTG